ncbi:ABC-type transport auxiliary lipoprotein family protein [Algihabitans albus]|uniref:ABC-type transport auxiliary lipoprotein family protein n=1 Tax=Algihabitans albus TaxID=2164067 RepID=UPI001F2607C3|nr:ABC-type transport auxiliary lipoprotein family protein [Algihabitans albus]
MKRRDDVMPPVQSERRRLLRAAGGFAALGALGGCAQLVPGQRPPPQFFRLSPKSTFDPDLSPVDWQLILEPPIANAALDTVRIALMREPMEVEYYARANWTDQAPQMVQTLMIESFENSRRIVSVGRESLGLRADFVIKSELREFQAEYFDGPVPMAHVGLNVKLVRMPRREIVASESFDVRFPAESDTLPSIVRAFDEALGSSLRALVHWTLQTGQSLYAETASS